MNLLQVFLQTKLDSSGFDWVRVESIQLSPSKKSLQADLRLAGEAELIRFSGTYSITPSNKIRIETLSASRQWLTEVAELALAKTGREFPLPEGIKGKMLKLFL